MINTYVKYSLAIIADIILAIFVVPTLINLHEDITTVAGFAIWCLQPVVIYLFIKSFIKSQTKKDTNTHA